MKEAPKIRIAIKMPLPSGRAVKAGRAVLAQFAHHAPSEAESPARMKRPKGGHGPRNPGE